MQVQESMLDFNKIVHKFGFPINLEILRGTYRFDSDIHEIAKFEDSLIEAAEGNEDFEKIAEIIVKNENLFDVPIYLLHIARYLEKEQYGEDILNKQFRKKGIYLDESIINRLASNDMSVDNIIITKLLEKGINHEYALEILKDSKKALEKSIWIPPQNSKSKSL